MIKTCAGRFSTASEFASPSIPRSTRLDAGVVLKEFVSPVSSGMWFLSSSWSRILFLPCSCSLLKFRLVCSFLASLLRLISTNLLWSSEIGLVCLCSSNGVAEQ